MRLVFLFLLILNSYCISAQKVSKFASLSFCGFRSKNVENLIKYLLPELAFLRLSPGDTLVDIGAQSGVYEASLTAIADLQNVHFILVDIDTLCLNHKKLSNVISHYEKFGRPISAQQFSIVHNTVDSLFLPIDQYRKALLRNVIHEIKRPEAFIKSIYNVLHSHGELIVMETIPTKKGKLHGGCRMPLFSFEELKTLFQKAGFHFVEKQDLLEGSKPRKHMLRFIKP
jgi:ubiquinone/menaquinone biosynthesis C-methylase UbiE